jgi:tetratricopeptide (TPR) repeat protein
MLADMQRVDELGRQQQYAEARELAMKVKGGLAWAGVRSAHVEWLLAVLSDYLAEPEQAYQHIMEAMQMDPVEPSIEKSFGIITDKLRRLLIDPEHDLTDESTPRLHAMLVEAGKADELVHIAMARHLAEVGKGDDAMKLLNAVLLLSPACRDAWAVKSMLAKKLGLIEEAATAEAEASACDGGTVPLFGIPGQAVA